LPVQHYYLPLYHSQHFVGTEASTGAALYAHNRPVFFFVKGDNPHYAGVYTLATTITLRRETSNAATFPGY